MPSPDDGSREAQTLVALLKGRGLSLATAESLTGGLLGSAVVAVPGASAAYLGGAVAYADAVKASLLGVPMELLRRHGAVSGETAAAMAQGALEKTGADCALATTGVAGPDGGTAETPVGTVWLGLALRGRPAQARRHLFAGDRAQVRAQAVQAALAWLADELAA